MKFPLMIGLASLTFSVVAQAQVAPRTAAKPAAPAVAQTAPQPARTVVNLWPGGAPGFEDRKDLPEQAASYWVKSINNPSMTVFLPDKAKATGAAVILCAGGGFAELGFVPEGIEAGEYFKSIGVAAFALKYRLPREPGSVYNMTHPRQDGLRAMRMVRSRAAEWGIDPTRIGMVGFSAGGEVVSMTTFGETKGDPAATDPIERVSARPDFIAEIYPGGGGIPQTLPPDAPTAFLLVANDDNHTKAVLDLFQLYRQARLPVEVHVFTKGAHAFNMGNRSKLATIKNWPQRLVEWMGDNNILDPTVPAKGDK